MKTHPPSIEPLETRIAPATLVNPTTLTYTDIDGDKVTVTTSAGAFAFANPPNGTSFTDTFVLTAPNAIGGQQLELIDLRQGSGFQGANLTVSVVAAGGGDGLAAVGLIFAPGIDLGNVFVKGDLGEIDCGDNDTATPALKLLSVRSMGRYGDATDPLSAGLQSNISGSLGALRVAEDIKDAIISVTANVSADAKIGSITIGGSLIGGAAVISGSIFAGGEIGPVKIGGSILGGDGNGSGAISADKLGTVAIGGSLVGGSGTDSGRIGVAGAIGAVNIGGNLIGGTGTGSAQIFSDTKLGAVTIGGSLLGGAGVSSGSLGSSGDIGPVKIAHDVAGGGGDESGHIEAAGKITSIAIGGSLMGGAGNHDTGSVGNSQIVAANIGAITIGHDVKGASGDGTGRIEAGGKLGAVTIRGALLGGSGFATGGITAATGIGAVNIGHDIVGGTGPFSGRVSSDGTLASVTVGGSLIGGGGNGSGAISSEGNLGLVKIGHDVIGGSGEFSGIIETGSIASVGGTMAGVTIGGSLIGGSKLSTGAVSSEGDMAFVKIGRDLVGGSISGMMPNLQGSGFIESDKRIGSVFIGGSVIAGMDNSTAGALLFNATINAERDIGSVTVKGGLIGNVTPNGQSLVIINAIGQATPTASTDLAIGKVSIGGRVEFARILAGYDDSSPPFGVNADAQIGSVSVGGDWIASSIVAGAVNLGANGAPGGGDDNINFGNDRDAKIDEMLATGQPESATIISKIGSITIKGQVFGTPRAVSMTDGFGFVAEQIGKLKIGARTFAFTPGVGGDGERLGFFTDGIVHDVAAHEIGAPIGVTGPALTAEATLVNASTVTYIDSDRDRVTVKLSRPLLTAANVNDVFKFDGGTVDGPPPGEFQQLRLIDLTPLATNGLGVTITVQRIGGDGLAQIGAIRSTGFDMGKITVPGDLGQIDGGDAVATTPGLAALKVRTLGRLGLDTQPPMSATFTPFLGGDILGGVGSIEVQQDAAGTSLAITGALGPLKIAGSLIGGSAAASGAITAQSIGAVTIGQHLQVGASAASGFIDSGTSIASVRIGGSVIGGIINADGTTLGATSIAGNVLGGLGMFSGRLSGNTGIGSVTIGGSLLGGAGDRSGQIFSGGGIGAVKISHNVAGSGANESGKIDSSGALASLTIGGSLIGGDGDQSTFNSGGVFHRAQVFAIGDIGSVTIGHDVLGAAGVASASISGANIAGVTVAGTVAGGSENDSARIKATDRIGAVNIGHGLLGGAGQNSGSLSTNNLVSVTVGGSLVGGTASAAGQIDGDAALGAVKIGHDVHGGSAGTSGYIVSDGKITSVTIGGSLLGGSANLTGGIFPTELGPVIIGRDLVGGSIAGTTSTLDRSGFIETFSRIASVSIGGSVIAGIDDSAGGALTANASIRAGDDLGSLAVKGSLIGNAAPNGTTPVIISARGQATPVGSIDVAIAKITIGGRVERTNIFAGFDTTLTPVNDGVEIGPVKVGRDWIASNLVAGVQNFGADGDPGGAGPAADNVNFGDAADVPIGAGVASRIASILIRGVVVGTATAGDHFGFSAVEIGSFKSLNFTAPLTPGTSNGSIPLSPITGDVAIHEV